MATSWKVKVNMAGVDQYGDIVNLPAGPYEVKPLKAVEHIAKADGPDGSPMSIWITVQVLKGEHKGKSIEVMLGLDLEKDANRRAWQGLAYSMGASDEKAHSEIEFTEEMILKKNGAPRTLYIYVTPPPEENGKPNWKKSYKNFISPAVYAEKVAALAAAPVVVSNEEPAVEAPPAPAPAPTKAKKAAAQKALIEEPAATAATPNDVDL